MTKASRAPRGAKKDAVEEGPWVVRSVKVRGARNPAEEMQRIMNEVHQLGLVQRFWTEEGRFFVIGQKSSISEGLPPGLAFLLGGMPPDGVHQAGVEGEPESVREPCEFARRVASTCMSIVGTRRAAPEEAAKKAVEELCRTATPEDMHTALEDIRFGIERHLKHHQEESTDAEKCLHTKGLRVAEQALSEAIQSRMC